LAEIPNNSLQAGNDDWYRLLISISDMLGFADDTTQEAELGFVETPVQRAIRFVGQTKVRYSMFSNRQVIIVVRVVNNPKDLIGDSRGDQYQEEAFGSGQDPVEICIIRQAHAEIQGTS
jgi:hypothetical protein